MRYNRFGITLLLSVSLAHGMCAQENVEKLVEKLDPAIQAQIQKVFDALQTAGADARCNMDVCREVQTLKKLSEDKDKLVKQLALFVTTMKSDENMHVVITAGILNGLDFPARIPIRVLAPYLEADNPELRDFAGIWFGAHDAGTRSPARSLSRNYYDYLEYVQWKVNRKQDIPKPFRKYLFEQSPDRALLIFAYANSHGDVPARMQAIRDTLEGKLTQEERTKISQQQKAERQARMAQRRDIELAEHIVNNALWLLKNKYSERFQQAAPEAQEQLAKLAQRKEWWARLYVAHIMRQHRELRRADVWESLQKDSEELVKGATQPRR
jgi:hypothetical protein